jgi:hypothetical protein
MQKIVGYHPEAEEEVSSGADAGRSKNGGYLCILLIETSYTNVRNALGETTIMPRNG